MSREKAVQESNYRYQPLLDRSLDGIWSGAYEEPIDITLPEMEVARLMNERGIIVQANDALARIYGFDKGAELEGKHWKEFISFQKSKEYYLRLIRSNYSIYGDISIERDSGGNAHYLENSVNADIINGKLVSAFGIVRDVSRRIQAEEAIIQEKEKSEAYLNIAGVMLAIIDVDENISLINNKGCETLGYKTEELMGQNWVDTLVPQRIRAEIRGVFGKLMAGDIEPVEYYENPLLTKDGEERLIAFHNTVIRNPGGQIAGALLSGEDVTERKKAEEALRSSEERLNIIFEYAPDGLYLSDLKGNFIDGNKAAEEITGYKRDELIGKNFLKLKLLPLKQIPKAAGLLAKNALRQSTGPDEFTLNQKNGTKVQLEISTFPVEIEGESLILGVARDITERKKAEEGRKNLEQRLQIASRLATVGEMASGIAHEINNPLTGVIGFSQLLMQKKDIPEGIREYTKIIHDGAQRMAGIVDRLLTFARQHKPERSYANINDIIEATLKLRAYEMESSNMKLTTQLDPDLPETVADAAQLQQVFLNIIINAEAEMKSAHGKGELQVKTEGTGNTIRISFKDDGPGIASENLEKVFDPFFTTREVGRGTGLGLSLCYGIIAEHHGRLYVRSKLGQGATFVVELPVVAEGKQVEPPKPATKELKTVTEARILVVDDEPSNLQLLTQLLSREGHRVETVESADAALEKIKSERYNLILLDIKLPGMSGMELYKEIKRTARTLARRVVFITGDVMAADTRGFLSRAKAPYVTKPFNIEELKNTINRTLARG